MHGLAAPGSGGAFHAKVMVVAGHERALVAIGSGDLSAAGWGLNKESWTVAKANREACPELVADVADWLRSLDSLCALAPLAARGISRTAALLEELASRPKSWTPGTAWCTPAPGRSSTSSRVARWTTCCCTRHPTTSAPPLSGNSSLGYARRG